MKMGSWRITGMILIVANLIECTPLKELNDELRAQDQDNWDLGVLISVSFSIISIGFLVFCAGAGIRCFRNIKIFERRKRGYEAPNSYQQGNHLNNSLSPNNVQGLELYPVIFEPLPTLPIPKINPVKEKDYQQVEPSSIIISASTSPPTDVNHVQKTQDSAEFFFSLSSPHASVSPLAFTTADSCQNLDNDVLLNNNNNNIGIEQEKMLQTPKANHHLGIEINVIEPTPSPNVKINLIHPTPNPSPATTPDNHNRENHHQQPQPHDNSDNSQPQPRLLRFKFDSPLGDVDRRKRRTSTPIKTPSPTLITTAELEDVFEPKDSLGNVYSVSPIKSNSSFEDTNTLNSIMETSLISETETDEENGARLLHGGSKAIPFFNGYEYTSDEERERVGESDFGTRSEFQLSKRVKRNLFLKEDDGNGNRADEQHDSALYNSWNIVDSNKIEANDLNDTPCDTTESDTNLNHSLKFDQIA